MVKKIFSLCLLASLSSCASLSEEECSLGDWHGIGYSDGVKGAAEDALLSHQKACSEYQIRVDFDAYHQGRSQGLRSYCQPHNGFQEGVKGAQYANVCPQDLAADFIAQYQQGLLIYNQQQRVEALEREIRRAEEAIKALKKTRSQVENKLVANGVDSAQRYKLLKDLRDLNADINTKKQNIYFNQAKLLQEQNSL